MCGLFLVVGILFGGVVYATVGEGLFDFVTIDGQAEDNTLTFVNGNGSINFSSDSSIGSEDQIDGIIKFGTKLEIRGYRQKDQDNYGPDTLILNSIKNDNVMSSIGIDNNGNVGLVSSSGAGLFVTENGDVAIIISD